jgi:hypothetical protein
MNDKIKIAKQYSCKKPFILNMLLKFKSKVKKKYILNTKKKGIPINEIPSNFKILNLETTLLENFFFLLISL